MELRLSAAFGRTFKFENAPGKTALVLAGLLLVLPLNLAIVMGALLYRAMYEGFGSRLGRSKAVEPKTILISGGKMSKALQLARSFYFAGHRVVLVDSPKYWLTGHRFSRCVDRFYTVPAPAHPTYASALLRIVEREGVNLYVPVCSPIASLYDSRAMTLLASHCDVIHVNPDTISLLDDKYRFFSAG